MNYFNMKFLDLFIQRSKEEFVLLLLDNYKNHDSSPVIEKVHEGGLVILIFPPHVSQTAATKLNQFLGSFKLNHNRNVNNWVSANPEKPPSIYDVSEMMGGAFPLVSTSRNTTLSVTGISPLNKDIFTGDDFLSSYVSIRQEPKTGYKK